MRPIRLEMRAFGPFAGSQVVEFHRLGENPLFLINGPTGAGKTTILDAICFALYGETTGQDRDAREMRSQHADPSTLTQVDFQFDLGAKRYRVTRTPEQERPKARGDGTTQQPASATFVEIQPDGSETVKVERKVTEVNAAVTELTGLSAEQFRQVMVLPQGRFRDFLLADSRKREEIFEQLFQTQVYSRIEDQLKIAAADIARRRKELDHNRDGILKNVGRETVAALREDIAALEPQVAEAKEAKENAEKALQAAQAALTQAQALAKRFEQYAGQKKQLGDLEAQAEEFSALEATIKLNRAALAIEAAYQRWGKSRDELAQAKKRQSNALSTLESARTAEQAARNASEAAQDQRQALEVARQKQRELERLKGRIDALQKAQLAAGERSTERAKAEAALNDAQAWLDKADNASREAAGMRDDAKAGETLHKIQDAELRQLQSTIGRLEKYQTLTAQISTRNAEINRVETDVDALKSRSDESSTGQKRIEHAWHAGQARLLAAELTDGAPCPVCGSLEHPRPASGDAPVPDEAAVEQVRALATQAHERWQARYNTLSELKAALKAHQGQLVDLTGELAGIDPFSLGDLKEQAADLNESLASLAALIRDLPTLEAKADAAARDLAAAERKVTDCNKALEDRKLEEARATQALTAASGEVPETYRAGGALESALQNVAAEQHMLERSIESLDTAFNEAKVSLTRAETELNLAVADLSERERQCEDASEAWQAALKKAGFGVEADFLSARKPSEAVDENETRLKSYQSAVEGARGALRVLEAELKDQAEPDLAALTGQVKASASAREAADQAYSGLSEQRNQLANADRTILEIEAGISRLDDEYRVVGTLSDVANGRNGRNVSLQRFVLSVLLEDVLEQASLRLHRMSKGRYDLCRAEGTKGRSASGLELEVLDAYTGRARPVSTLSGGESFMAALALALGLSDVVQGYAGGIRLDALFIDEGFGSLDAESLDLAINTLMDLRQSGRMVGIISHVSELRERINVRIDVLTGRDGATIELHA